MKSGLYQFPDLGPVKVTVRSTARNICARWKAGIVHVSVPPSVTADRLAEALSELMPRLASAQPEMPYHIGQTIVFPDFKVTISSQRHSPDRIFAQFDDNRNGIIEVGTAWQMDSADTMKTIDRFICRMAQTMAPMLLLPRAQEIAAEVGRRPLSWTISNGHRTLGRCTSQGVIALSYALVFYPEHLRDYVIKHELAHLTELNHSARFHEVCDAYCNGREKELEAELRVYKVPMLR